MSEISVFANSLIDNQTIPLIGSKSESNRALIINALSDSPGKISNLATARDTEIMSRLLSSRDKQYDAMDAGTVMRFMTAFLAISKEKALITGTDRMKQRPIYVLVDALRELGCQIKYLEEVGYPPLEIKGFSQQLTNKLRVNQQRRTLRFASLYPYRQIRMPRTELIR